MELTDPIEDEHYQAQTTLGQMDNYYRWILSTFGDHFGRRIWDAGAGVGHVTQLLLPRADFLLATEFTERNLATLRTRFADRPEVQIQFCDLTSPAALDLRELDLDTIVTLDVLEHLENDREALERYFEILRPGGALLIKVPAHPFLYGTMDEASLHHRRYGKRELRAKLEGAGFRVERLRHMNMAATLPYFVKGRLLRRKRNFSGTIDGGKLGFYNRVMPWLERAERVLPTPFGLSLVAVGLKP